MLSKEEQCVCKIYNIYPRKIKDKQLLEIMELLTYYFGELKFLSMISPMDCSIMATSPETTVVDEEYPLMGTGWCIKEAILKQIQTPPAVCDTDFYEDVRNVLLTPFEKLMEYIFG